MAADGATVRLDSRVYAWNAQLTLPTELQSRVTIVGAGQGSTVLDRKRRGRFFRINSGGSVDVRQATLANGSAAPSKSETKD